MTFAGRPKIEFTKIQLNSVIKQIIDLMQPVIEKNIKIITNLSKDEIVIRSSLFQIERILMNLVMNAKDALGPPGGEIRISTQVASESKKEVSEGIGSCAEAVVIVADNGCGIPKHLQQRIFEPFFTTKASGNGAGLGLAMVYGIVREHGGRITVESNIGEGATFTVYLPCLKEEIDSTWIGKDSAKKSVEEKLPAVGENKKTILIVDDEEDILASMKHILTTPALDVLTLSSPIEALNRLMLERQTISLLISDLTMAEMNGAELIHMAKTFKPDLKVIVMSALERARLEQIVSGVEVDEIIQKPFVPEDIISAVNRVLE